MTDLNGNPGASPGANPLSNISIPDMTEIAGELAKSRVAVIQPVLEFIRNQQELGQLDQWTLSKAIDHVNYLALVLRNGHENFVKQKQDAAIAQQLSALVAANQ